MTTRDAFPGAYETTRKNKRGETVPLLQYKRENEGKRFKRNLPGPWGSAAFVRAYDKAKAEAEAFFATGIKATPGRTFDEKGKRVLKPTTRPEYAARWDTTSALDGSLRWLVERYLESPLYLSLDPRNRVQRAIRLRNLGRVPYKADDGTVGTWGDLNFRNLELTDMEEVQAHYRETPGKADCMLADLSAMFSWAIRDKAIRLRFNPCTGIERLSSGGRGHPPWLAEHLDAFEAYWPVGTLERLAYEFFLQAGLRISDVWRVGRAHDKGAYLSLVEYKGSHSRALKHAPKPKQRLEDLAINDELRAVIDATKIKGELVYVLDPKKGLPFKTVDGFSAKFIRWARKAGVPEGYSAHGLRKTAANRILQGGGSHADIMSLLGHSTPHEAERYGKEFERIQGGKRAAKIVGLASAAKRKGNA